MTGTKAPPDFQGTDAAVFGPDVGELREAIIPALKRLGYGEHMAREMGLVLVFQPSARRTQQMFEQVLEERNDLARAAEALLEHGADALDAVEPRNALRAALARIAARVDRGATASWRSP